MKSLTLLLGIFCTQNIYGQTNPHAFFATPELIHGKGQVGDTIAISTDQDFSADHKILVSNTGDFKLNFPTPLTIGENIIIWSINSNNELSQRVTVKVDQPSSILEEISNNKTSASNFTNYTVAGKTVRYKATIVNTNFSIPLARFNFTEDDDRKTGELLLFNSIGAGFGISAGELSETRDLQGDLINQQFTNTIGAYLGFLFSAGTGDDAMNVFAPTFNVNILDFQIGMGYELGTLSENQKPFFLTLSYAIPLYKLKRGGYWIWMAAEPISSPLESRQGEL